MKNFRIGLSFFSVAAFVLIASSFAQAQNDRTWVSAAAGVVDNGTCSRTVPCRTFAGALLVTNQQGEINVLDPGEYSNLGGTVIINKSVTIDGGGIGFLTVTGGSAISVITTDVHDVVTIRNLSINGGHFGGVPAAQKNGIQFGASPSSATGALVVEKCQINNFSGAGIAFTPTGGGGLFVRDCDFTNNEFFGIHIDNATSGLATCSIDNVRLSNNGIFGTGSGIILGSRTQANISDSVIAYNGLVGIQVSPGAGLGEANVENTSLVGNNINLQSGFSASPGTIRISNVDIFDATANGLAFTGGSNILSFGNNRIAFNIGSNGPPSGFIPQQ